MGRYGVKVFIIFTLFNKSREKIIELEIHLD